jgi:hypothetical protein
MAFLTLDDMVAGLTGGAYYISASRASLSAAVAGTQMSLWRATGFPAQGAIPTAAAICTDATVGAVPLALRSGGQERIVPALEILSAAANNTFILEDRLMHMGGLSGTVTTAQTASVDLHGSIGTSNLAARIGAADYSEVEWWLEWYTATGATVSTPTAQVTFHDDTTGSVNIWVLGATALPATVAASRRYKLVPTNGKFIRSVQTVTLSATTGTAGNFGVTCTRTLCAAFVPLANALMQFDWLALKSPRVADSACMTFGQNCITTTTGATSINITQAVQ